jgi:hypothetical protein
MLWKPCLDFYVQGGFATCGAYAIIVALAKEKWRLKNTTLYYKYRNNILNNIITIRYINTLLLEIVKLYFSLDYLGLLSSSQFNMNSRRLRILRIFENVKSIPTWAKSSKRRTSATSSRAYLGSLWTPHLEKQCTYSFRNLPALGWIPPSDPSGINDDTHSSGV